MFHEARPYDKEKFYKKATFDSTPSLIVLSELSSYLAEDAEATYVSLTDSYETYIVIA